MIQDIFVFLAGFVAGFVSATIYTVFALRKKLIRAFERYHR